MQLIKFTLVVIFWVCLSGCATYVKSGSDEDKVRLFKNGFMTTYDTFLRAAEFCLERGKLAELEEEWIYGDFEDNPFSTPTETYWCIEL